MTNEYHDFIQQKRIIFAGQGKDVNDDDIHPALFGHQRALVKWAARKGQAAIFADTGLGKTPVQAEWARLMGGRTLIIAPLSVARQTVRIVRQLLGIDIHYTRSGTDVVDGINITNYEMAHHFDPAIFDNVVLDESSILKAMDGKTRQALTAMFARTRHKLCCTATPAPNDLTEIGNHAEFLGVTTRAEMLATFFVNTGKDWEIKSHAVDAFYRWMASWGMSVRKPSDIDYPDDGYILPPLHVTPIWLSVDVKPTNSLIFMGLKGIQGRLEVRRQGTTARVAKIAKLVANTGGQIIIWHGLNEEGEALRKAIPDSVLVEGSQSPEDKAQAIEDFQDDRYRVLITKSKIAGFGINLQNATTQIFCGLSDSWEGYYQSVRRSWRFGQSNPVHILVVLTDIEAEIWENVQRKEAEARQTAEYLIAHVREFEREELRAVRETNGYHPTKVMKLPDWLRAA